MWNGGSGTRGQAGFASGPKHNYAHHAGQRMGQPHSQTGGGPGGGMSGANIDSMSWEELYDSGNLEVHLKTRLNLGGQIGVPPGPPPQMHPMYHVGQMGLHANPMNGVVNGTSVIQPLMSIVTRPPVECQVPPPPLPHQRIMMRPSYDSYNNPPPPMFTQPPPPIVGPRGPQIQPRPVIMKRPEGSNPNPCPPPFRGSSSSANYSTRITQNTIHTAESDSSIFVKPVEVEIISDHPRTQYKPPEPKVKILKRPSSTPSNLSGQEQPPSGPGSSTSTTVVSPAAQASPEDPHKTIQTKSLKEREEEYNQARLRIFGSIEAPDTVAESENTVTPSKTVNSSNNDNVLRSPKGPDGTSGFKLKR